MNITDDVISDLLPLYLSNECSIDTKKLVDEYLKANPSFEEQVKSFSKNPLPTAALHFPGKPEEMNALKKAKRLLKLRTYLLAFAILCTLSPFSFTCTDGKFFWLYSENPGGAAVYAGFAMIFWTGYFVTKNKLKGI